MGPFPAYHRRDQSDYQDGRPKPENKGVKKRKQQQIFAEFKAWRKRNKRHFWG
jgi:hypothetical protein